MVDVLLLIAFIALPVASWVVSRSLLFVAVWLGLGIGIAGNIVQGSIALGASWTVRGLQGLVIAVMAAVVALAWARRRRSAQTSRSQGSLRRQFITIVVPSLVIGMYLLAMRLLAPVSPGALSAVGYLINHPQAEDNAKWLNLSAQLADGRAIEFTGYAGGPLLLVMGVMAALISVLSIVLLGGVNEVAVAANTVVATQFLLITLVPFALAVFAEVRLRAKRGAAHAGAASIVPAVLVWVGMLTVALASSIVTSYGHLSLQFVLLVLVAWFAIYALSGSRWLQLAASLTVVTAASVWLPMTAVAVATIVVLLVWMVRRRWWWGLGLLIVTVLVSWDALSSSTLYLLGIDVSSIPLVGTALSTAGGDEGVAAVEGPSGEVITTAHLFRAPGATEVATPLLVVVAAVALMAVVWLLTRSPSKAPGAASGKRLAWKLAPLMIVGGYVGVVALLDSISTATSPNYSLNKSLFALVIVMIGAYVPIALMALDAPQARMTALRWAGAGAIVLVLVVDTLLPRALSALSPLLWPAVDSSAPVYWSAAEVKNQASQPISSLPVACIFAPPTSDVPTALPLGQESYSCTRLLVGLTGSEATMRGTPIFLQTEWLSQQSNWDEMSELVEGDAENNPGRSVILMNPSGGLAGIGQLDEIVARN